MLDYSQIVHMVTKICSLRHRIHAHSEPVFIISSIYDLMLNVFNASDNRYYVNLPRHPELASGSPGLVTLEILK